MAQECDIGAALAVRAGDLVRVESDNEWVRGAGRVATRPQAHPGGAAGAVVVFLADNAPGLAVMVPPDTVTRLED